MGDLHAGGWEASREQHVQGSEESRAEQSEMLNCDAAATEGSA